jgi:lipopolysaccharide transport system ATP-binding protein
MSDVIIRAENLGKSYRIRHTDRPERYTALRDVLSRQAHCALRRLRRPFRRDRSAPSAQNEEFWALKDVSFEIKRGEAVGIIGRNGAGKSTLLKILSRITEPTAGRVRLRGRVASLLEVGTGFHPELTGRENIYLNGAILGMTRAEITRKFDEIVDFAGVEKFLDTPVKRYSSGMYVRLAFAVAAHLEPEILVVDEVLAVGDAEFQKKCLGKMEDVASQGRTVLFVSHQLNSVRAMCSRAILLTAGGLSAQGAPDAIINDYLASGSTDGAWHSNGSRQFDNPAFSVTAFQIVDETLTAVSQAMPRDRRLGVLISGTVRALNPLVNVGYAHYS